MSIILTNLNFFGNIQMQIRVYYVMFKYIALIYQHLILYDTEYSYCADYDIQYPY